MNHIIDRESAAMRLFASAAHGVADGLEEACTHLKQLLYEANGYMQDKSGQEAIAIVAELAEDTSLMAGMIHTLSERIQKSAELLEESDTLL